MSKVRTKGSQRNTLEERVVGRRQKFILQSNMTIIMGGHVRAELDRLARQVRNLDCTSRCETIVHGYYQALHDVLALLKEAKK